MQKKHFTLLFILLFSIGGLMPSEAQNLNHDWSLAVGGPGALNVAASAVTVDAAGNTYSTGILVGTADFDPGLGTAEFTSASPGTYIVKYDPNGNYVWAKIITCDDTSLVAPTSIALDQSGNIFIGGDFQGTADFDPGLGTASLTTASATYSHMFIAKYDANGNYLWVKDETGNGQSRLLDVATDAAGNIYATGNFTDTANFGSGFSFRVDGTLGRTDMFIIKYNAGGNLEWARSIGGDEMDESTAIAVDSTGNVYITGYFNSTVIDFDPRPDFEVLFPGAGVGWKMFIAKYTSDGNYVWAKNMAGTSVGWVADITLDAEGHLYVIGDFRGVMDMDPDTAVVRQLTSTGEFDIYLAKYDTSGHYTWAKSFGGAGYDKGRSVICANGSVYIQGTFKDTVDFDPAATTANLGSDNDNFTDIFVARYDPNGHYLWVGSFITTGYNNCMNLCMDGNSNLYSTGLFGRNIDLDPGPASEIKTSSGLAPFSFNTYIVKMNAGCTKFLGFTESNCDSFIFNGNAYMASGTYGDTFHSAANCDSISTLYLTITGHTSVNDKVIAHYCDSVSLNGITYKTSGVYTQHYNTITGCDSSFIYDLTIGQTSIASSASYTACDSFVINDTLVFTSTSFRTVTFTNASGCDSEVVFDVVINPSPQAIVTRSGTTLTASRAGSYQWLNCDGNTVIDGATAQQYTPEAAGSYAVVVTSVDCSDTSDCVEVNNANAVHGLGKNNKIQLYPNPASGQVTLQSKQTWDNATIRLINTIGQTLSVYTNVKGSVFMIDIARYPAGVYLVEISEANESARLKLTKD